MTATDDVVLRAVEEFLGPYSDTDEWMNKQRRSLESTIRTSLADALEADALLDALLDRGVKNARVQVLDDGGWVAINYRGSIRGVLGKKEPETPRPLNARRLVYDFVELPSYKQISIARDLGLLESDEGRASDRENRTLIFTRAGERQMLNKLRAAVDKALGKEPDDG